MPRGDRTGPNGMGPMTGRAAGYCAGYSTPGFMNPGGGRGMGMARGFRGGGGGGRGFGRGFGYQYPVNAGYYPNVAPAAQYPVAGEPVYDSGQELEMLKNQAEYMKSSLENIKQRIEDLESKASGKE